MKKINNYSVKAGIFGSLIALLLLSGCSSESSYHQKAQSMQHDASHKATDFLNQVNALKAQPLMTLPLSRLLSASHTDVENKSLDVKVNLLFDEENAIAVEDGYRHDNGLIHLAEYKEIGANDILNVFEHYIVIVLKDTLSSEIRALTVSREGVPIESILLHNQFGNNEYKLSRAFSEEKAFDYNALGNYFTFTDLRLDTEWITFPTHGESVVTSEEVFTVSIDEHGHFFVKQ